jgi:hypothetical protein
MFESPEGKNPPQPRWVTILILVVIVLGTLGWILSYK